nr:hypothetical protein BaRGS_004654 [Batillaria attramentaria]
MKNNQLQVSSAFRATPSVYQACLHYTMLARLAPLWNKAGDWLIQEFDLVANTQELYISAGEVAVPGFWCHVLPSMKKGRLCSVSLSIPADSPFTSYRDLKRHWKNTYGYRLPETDDDIFYGQISFWATGGKQFTYPSVCLRAGPIQPVPRVEPRPILSAFLQDLHVKLPSVCGQPVKFQPQLRHTCAALYPASQPGLVTSQKTGNEEGFGQGASQQARKLKLKMMESVHDPTASPKATVPSGKTLCNTDLFSGLSPSPALTPGMQGNAKLKGSEERKRARSKPQVQDVDVELLAKTNQVKLVIIIMLQPKQAPRT